jgi:uncharacterized protein (TIGR00369 family)
MDYEALAAGYQEAIPFNKHLGLEVAELGEGRGVVRLPVDDVLRNHVGSQHAGALFTAGEAASGGAFVGTFAEQMANITPLAKSAEISYLKVARGPITATATLPQSAESLTSKLEAEGKVVFPVNVALADEDGNTVAEMRVDWHVRKNG